MVKRKTTAEVEKEWEKKLKLVQLDTENEEEEEEKPKRSTRKKGFQKAPPKKQKVANTPKAPKKGPSSQPVASKEKLEVLAKMVSWFFVILMGLERKNQG